MEPEPLTHNQKQLLVACFLDNLRLDDAERIEFMEILQTPEYQGVYPVVKSYYEDATEKAQRRSIERVLQRRFGPVGETVRQRIAAYPADKLDELLESAVDAPSPKDLGLED